MSFRRTCTIGRVARHEQCRAVADRFGHNLRVCRVAQPGGPDFQDWRLLARPSSTANNPKITTGTATMPMPKK